jgi:hypothetical protein
VLKQVTYGWFSIPFLLLISGLDFTGIERSAKKSVKIIASGGRDGTIPKSVEGEKR